MPSPRKPEKQPKYPPNPQDKKPDQKNQPPDHHQKLQKISAAKAESQMHLASIIAQKTRFDWQKQPQDNWAGYSQEALLELTQYIARLLGITSQQALVTEIVFADEERPGGKAFLAATTVTFNIDGTIFKCKLVFNRSRELYNEIDAGNPALGKNTRQQKSTKKVEDIEVNKPELLQFALKDPLEYLVWMIGEELCHTKLYCMAKTKQKHSMIHAKFSEILVKKNRVSSIPYDNLYQEVTVARQCLKLLKKLYPSRAALYENVYQDSLKTGKRPFPKIGNIKDEIFIP